MPRTTQFLWNVCMNIYQDMFKAANPSLDFFKALKEEKTKENNWFMKYYLSEKEQIKIVNYYGKKHHLTNYEKMRIDREIFLGSAPNSSLKSWKKLKEKEE